MMAAGDTVCTDGVWLRDKREVNMSVTGAPLLYTPSGARPIDPCHVSITYDIATRTVTSVTVNGHGAPNPRNYRERSGFVRRRVEPDAAPCWLADLIEKHRP